MPERSVLTERSWTVTVIRDFWYAGVWRQVGDSITVPVNVARGMIEAGNALNAPDWPSQATNIPWALQGVQESSSGGGGGGGSPAGANGQIQWNDNGAFGASDKFSITFGSDSAYTSSATDLYLVGPGQPIPGNTYQRKAWLHISGAVTPPDYISPEGVGGIVFENAASPNFYAPLQQAMIYCSPLQNPAGSKISFWTYSVYAPTPWAERMNVSYFGTTITGTLAANSAGFSSRVDIGNPNDDNVMLWILGRSSDPDRNSNQPMYNSVAVIQANGYLTIGAADPATAPYFPGPFWIQGYSGNITNLWLDVSLQPLGGKVGVGVLRPQYTLDVAGDVNIVGQYLQNGSPVVLLSQSDYDQLIMRVSALEERMA